MKTVFVLGIDSQNIRVWKSTLLVFLFAQSTLGITVECLQWPTSADSTKSGRVAALTSSQAHSGRALVHDQ